MRGCACLLNLPPKRFSPYALEPVRISFSVPEKTTRSRVGRSEALILLHVTCQLLFNKTQSFDRAMRKNSPLARLCFRNPPPRSGRKKLIALQEFFFLPGYALRHSWHKPLLRKTRFYSLAARASQLAASIRKFWKNLAAVKTARCEIDAPTSLQPDDSFEKITSLGKGF